MTVSSLASLVSTSSLVESLVLQSCQAVTLNITTAQLNHPLYQVTCTCSFSFSCTCNLYKLNL